MSLKIKITGDKEIAAKLKALGKKSATALKKAIIQSAVYVEGEAKERITAVKAVKTGRLRASITHEVTDKGSKISGRVGTNVEYAPHVEFGTVKMPARPYLTWALLNSKNKILEFIDKVFKELKL